MLCAFGQLLKMDGNLPGYLTQRMYFLRLGEAHHAMQPRVSSSSAPDRSKARKHPLSGALAPVGPNTVLAQREEPGFKAIARKSRRHSAWNSLRANFSTSATLPRDEASPCTDAAISRIVRFPSTCCTKGS